MLFNNLATKHKNVFITTTYFFLLIAFVISGHWSGKNWVGEADQTTPIHYGPQEHTAHHQQISPLIRRIHANEVPTHHSHQTNFDLHIS